MPNQFESQPDLGCGNPLADQPQWLRATLATISDAVLIFDANGRLTFLNPAAATLTGWEFTRAHGRPAQTILDLVDPETGNPAEDIIAPVLSEARPVVYPKQIALITEDRRILSIAYTAAPIADGAGTVTGVVLVLRDETGHKRVEETLRRHSAILESTDDAIIGKTLDGIVTSSNPGTETLYGYTPAEIIGQSVSILIPQEHPDELSELMRRLAQGDRIEHFETKRRRKDGTLIDVAVSIVPVRDSQGNIIGASSIGRDITELRRRDLALEEREERLRMQVERMPIGCVLVDRHNCFIDLNPAAERILGYTAEELRGRHVDTIVPEADRPHVDSIMRRLAEGDMTAHSENENLTKDGRVIICQWTNTPLRDASGNFTGFLSMAQDVTERKRADEALRRSESRYQSSIELTGMLAWGTDAHGNAVEDCPTWRKFTGLSYEQMKGAGWADAIHPEDRDRARQIWTASTTQKTRYEVEYRLRRFDGVYRIFLVRGTPMFEPDGRVREWVGTCTDITERKRSELRLRRFYETDLFAILYWRIDGGVIDVNDKFLEMTGYTRDDLRAGRLNWSQMTPPEYHALDEDARRQVRDTGVHLPYEKEFVRKDGTRVWGLFSAVAWEDNRDEGVSIILDLTERKLAEEALLRSEKLAFQREQMQALAQQIGRAREEERSRVSRDLHDDIGQILTAIKMDLKWISKRVQEPTVAGRLTGTVDLVNDGVRSVRTICSRLRPSMLDDLGLAAAIEWQAKEFTARTGIACETHLVSEKQNLDTDQTTAFFRIFQECLTNVSRHSEATHVAVLLFLSDGDLVMEVCDNGRGFDEAGVTRSLGILGMRERSRACGGDVQVISAPGAGTTIRARIPVSVGPRPEDSLARAERG